MIFTYQKWDEFCRKLRDQGIISVPAKDVLANMVTAPYLVLKHDVETDVSRAYEIAKIEHKYGHRGSYYVQAYLLHNRKNIHLLQEMKTMGHEVSYHYDVLDSNKGDIDQAITEFEANATLFARHGFEISTVCQHGNPVIERVGYHSNRDFFRNAKVQRLYPLMADIMVDFTIKAQTTYQYFSDAGRKFHMIFDPINNDITPSDDRNIGFEDLDAVLECVCGSSSIVSIHPHRWCTSAFSYTMKTRIFKVVRYIAKKLMTIPFIKKLMGKFYYLAKKI